MNKGAFIYSNDFKELDFGFGHPMRGDRYEKALEEFRKLNLLNNLVMKEPVLISEDIINLFHTPSYIKKVRDVSRLGQGVFGEEAPGFRGIYDVALLSVSASITAANYILDNNSFVTAINICGGLAPRF
jgi:acetoin utilization protein AcuC